jgi:hypothetical protein
VSGLQLELIWRQDNVAVFARSFPGKPPHKYEVIIVRIARASVLPSGSTVPEREEYPSSSKWGNSAGRSLSVIKRLGGLSTVLANLGKTKEERTAWPELFSQFKRTLII